MKPLITLLIIIAAMVAVLLLIQGTKNEEISAVSTPIPVSPTQSPPQRPATPTPKYQTTSGGMRYLSQGSTKQQQTPPPLRNPQSKNAGSKRDIIYRVAKKHNITITQYQENTIGKVMLTGVAPVHYAFGEFMGDLIREINMRDFNEDKKYFKKVTTKQGKWLYRAKFEIFY